MNKFFAVVAVMFATVSAQASYLWWEVNSNASDMGDVSAWIDGEGGEWTTAKVYAYEDTAGKSSADVIGSASAAHVNEPIVSWVGQIDLSTLSNGGAGYSYYVELVNNSGTVVGYSETPTAYADLSGSITETLSEMPKMTVWHGGSSYKAAPEPTSAMLMLLGVAGLALRRKQRKLA